MLELRNISYSIGTNKILDNISATFQPGKLSMIIGPNGSGKSTLLKIISQEIEGYSGSVLYDSKQLTKKNIPVISKVRAVLTQQPELSFPLPVEEVVLMGRYPHFAFTPSIKDKEICIKAMERMNIASFKHRNYLTLSGGERQRVHFARVLAQIWEEQLGKCRYFLLDEPITSLDLNYQHEFLKLAKQMSTQHTVTVAVIHDINLALQYADHVLMIYQGCVMADGTPKDVITPENLFKLYNLKCKVINDPDVKFPHFVVE